MTKRAVVVGSKGQDGRILVAQLKGMGIEVLEIYRNSETSLGKKHSLREMFQHFSPDEVYYLAAIHHSSQDAPRNETRDFYEQCKAVHVDGLSECLEQAKNFCPAARFFYASSSHVFGDPSQIPQNEETELKPLTVYGKSKHEGMKVIEFFRDHHNIFASVGILFNHDSILREDRFFTQKVVNFAKISRVGEPSRLILGSLDAMIDFGYAPDTVKAMQSILSLKDPGMFVVSTGESHSTGDFVDRTFRKFGLNWKDHVIVDSSLLSRRNFEYLGDSSKLFRETGWKPSVRFSEFIDRMIDDNSLNSLL